ncbi:hypothetical protein [Arhodomonas sp. AD133]|uniref:hypothetical protein n=1 Tax=Arhodomonas sp. AD133 TaxID=3415009 RepID=UPI003EBAB338
MPYASRYIPAVTYRGRYQTPAGHATALYAALGHCRVLINRHAGDADAQVPTLALVRATLAECRPYAPDLRTPQTLADAPAAIAHARQVLRHVGADPAPAADWQADFQAWLAFETARGTDNWRPAIQREARATFTERQRATVLLMGLIHADACAQLARGNAAEYAALVMCRAALRPCRDYCYGLWKPDNVSEARQLLNKAADQLWAIGADYDGLADAERSVADWLAWALGDEVRRIAPDSLAGGVCSVRHATPLHPDATPPRHRIRRCRPGASYTNPAESPPRT